MINFSKLSKIIYKINKKLLILLIFIFFFLYKTKADSIQSSKLFNVLFSDDITLFIENKIPVNDTIFNFHVSKIEFEVPMVYNNLVKNQIDFFGTRWQYKLKKMIRESEYYFPIYKKVLDKNNIPFELVYLSVIESALNPLAESKSGAVGLWQFMPQTGKIYKLEQTRYIDERRDIEKSTEAACIYLKGMYEHYGDWLLAIASYNCGPGNVNKAIRNSGGSKDFWTICKYLPKETQYYVPKFIAMAYLMNFYEYYGIIPALNKEYREDFFSVLISDSRIDIRSFCQKIDIDIDTFRKHNPSIKHSGLIYLTNPLTIYIPNSNLDLFYSKDSSDIIELKEDIEKVKYHIVKRGESLPVVALKYKCTVFDLKKWNNLINNTIHPEQKLEIRN
jgi:membrane-bound lytic murein transglycosylase D